MTLPEPTRLGPLVASRRLPARGGSIAILAGGLSGRVAELVLAGPGYTAVRDIRITHGLTGARVVLPRGSHKGRWYAGIIDYHGLRLSHDKLRGKALLEAASWVVR